ncbi:Protein CBG19084 [Caenorhabditis briggsae]|uniref:Protein CBG19084 n=1 Tax=Caenorhabditis briggsae TaxID=6238 RepID=A8XUR3_CAEBR|nr:Protein CBG19084 [Caenorhabditis briggsae]CAP36388.1 Protein CBG19084 [Caenorhabditis briggsae]
MKKTTWNFKQNQRELYRKLFGSTNRKSLNSSEHSYIPRVFEKIDVSGMCKAEHFEEPDRKKLKKNHSDFVLSRQLGMINDSFELTVVPKSNTSIYIDLYSFYKEKDSEKRWVGGMGDSGEKFKFPYLPYDPWCSADLHGHLFWVACTPAKMVEAEYGKLWYEDRPTSEYLWNTQARPNGRWSERQMKEVYKVYVYDP